MTESEREFLSEVKIGALCWNQYSDWPRLLAGGRPRRRAGLRHALDVGPPLPDRRRLDRPELRGLADDHGLGAGHAPGPDRADGRRQHVPRADPTAKLATTLDHISGGRAILGIGGAWFGEEHEDFGLDFGSGFPERLRWLGEALPIMRGMLDGTEPTARGDHYHSQDTRNLPAPVQAHLPICIGGGGEKVTLKLVAKYGDMNNVGGGIAAVRHKEQVLLEHCETVGRDPAEIERTTGVGTIVIRDSRAEAERIFHEAFDRNRVAHHWEDQPVGTPEDVAEKLAPYLDIGYRHLISGFPRQLRRGVDDPVRDRGPAAARERLGGRGPSSSGVRCFER